MADTSFFPSIGAVNPALTAIANAHPRRRAHRRAARRERQRTGLGAGAAPGPGGDIHADGREGMRGVPRAGDARPLAVRLHDRQPLLLRPGDDRARLPHRDAADRLVPAAKPRVPAADPVLRHPAGHQRRHRRRHRASAGVRVRHELVVVLAAGRQHLRRAAGDGGPGRLLPRVHVPRACGCSAGTSCPAACTWRRSGWSSFGSVLSAAFIMAANSWMQHPVGYVMVNGKPQLNDIWALFTNPVFVWGYTKVVLAAIVTGAAVMLAVSAWQLRHGGEPARCSAVSARLSLAVLVPAILLTMLVGDELGVIEARYQPMKIAAAEAQWTTCQPCSFSLFQIGGGNNDQTPTQILEIPHLLSLLATNHWNGQVIGLNQLQAQYTKQYGPGNYIPNVFIQYWGMRVMAYLAVLVTLVGLWGLWLVRRKTARHLPGLPVVRDLAGRAAVPDEHRGLAAHRERPPALDRAGHHADQERALPDRQHHLAGDQPGLFRAALRHPRHRRPDPHAALLAASSSSRRRTGARHRPARARRSSTEVFRWVSSRSGTSSSRSCGPGSSSSRGSTSASACCTAWSAGTTLAAGRSSTRSGRCGTGTRSG